MAKYYNPVNFNYFVIPQSSTTTNIGPVGGKGDYLASIFSGGTGAVTLFDGATAFMTLATTVANTVIPIGVYSKNGAWNLTTAASTPVTAIGQFS